MAPTIYTGALQPKKKAELQEIASSLRINDEGTREDLQTRIKKHLDMNPILEEDPVYAGLFGKRKKPAPPSSRFARSDATSTVEETRKKKDDIRSSRRLTIPEPDSLENTMGDASALQDDSPDAPEPALKTNPTVIRHAATRDHPPAPPSPFKSVLDISRREVEVIVDMVKRQEQTALRSANVSLVKLRSLLSNAGNIWLLSALLELTYILWVIIPWRVTELPLSSSAGPFQSISVPYPPLVIFRTSAFWTTLWHWALPTLIIPSTFGAVISFQGATALPRPPYDTLTASIIRLAVHMAYPYSTLGVEGADVLGSRTRILSAAVGLAFAFAEAIAKAPAHRGRVVEYSRDDSDDEAAQSNLGR